MSYLGIHPKLGVVFKDMVQALKKNVCTQKFIFLLYQDLE